MNNISEVLDGVKTMAIAGHIRPDGDCVGTCMALYLYIKNNYPDIDVKVYLEEPKPIFGHIDRIDEICTELDENRENDLFVTCDVSSRDRLAIAEQYLDTAKTTVCIDHHVSNIGFAAVNHVKGDISSCSEVLYRLLDKDKINRAVASAIYTGMIHDTGVFQYSSTSPDTMRIAADLMETGFEFNRIIDQSFYEKTYLQNQIMGRILAESILLMNGACIMGCMRKKDMDFYGVDGKDLDGVVSQLRLTKGVEVALFLYETDIQKFKVSMRSNGNVDVSKVAVYFGGGGHTKAAGCELQGSVYDVVNNLTREIERQILLEKAQ